MLDALRKRLTSLATGVAESMARLSIDELRDEVRGLEETVSQPEIWNNPAYAQEQTKALAALQSRVEPWDTLHAQALDMQELLEMEGGEELAGEFDGQIAALEATFEQLKQDLRYQGEFDDHNAILRLSAGVGGTDAQDWTEMLERMYLRWAERAGLKATIVEHSKGEEAGVKSVTLGIEGAFAYGKLRSEHGVHRLVRLSPFNSDNLRQTSFALVEVLPEIDTPDDVQLDEKDLKIDVYRAGGHGGQSVNTTDSAVRITHLPTGITVAIQNERSQLQNKETALKILRSKLTQLRLEQHAASVADLQAGESANWGSQIRNYVLHPYTLVKDTRTKYEDKNAAKVLDGDIDAFIDAYHTQAVS